MLYTPTLSKSLQIVSFPSNLPCPPPFPKDLSNFPPPLLPKPVVHNFFCETLHYIPFSRLSLAFCQLERNRNACTLRGGQECEKRNYYAEVVKGFLLFLPLTSTMSGLQSQGVTVPRTQQLRFKKASTTKPQPNPNTAALRPQEPGLLKDHNLRFAFARWNPTTLTAFRLILLIRFCAAMYTSISDCDEGMLPLSLYSTRIRLIE